MFTFAFGFVVGFIFSLVVAHYGLATIEAYVASIFKSNVKQ
jgi:hypothetical protein